MRKYLNAYMTIMSERPYRTIYIDAFAGTGSINLKSSHVFEPDLFSQEEATQAAEAIHGSARIALEIEPSFDEHIFIDKRRKHVAALQQMLDDYPARLPTTRIIQGDANSILQEACRGAWRDARAVVFLDPYGMRVDWPTIAALAATRAVDLWILFPVFAVNRVLKRDGKLPPAWRRRMNRMLGTEEWLQEFYQPDSQQDFLESEPSLLKRANFASIGKFFVRRLETEFPHVASDPGLLSTSRGNPLFLLCFAGANPHARAALKIANDLLKRI